MMMVFRSLVLVFRSKFSFVQIDYWLINGYIICNCFPIVSDVDACWISVFFSLNNFDFIKIRSCDILNENFWFCMHPYNCECVNEAHIESKILCCLPHALSDCVTVGKGHAFSSIIVSVNKNLFFSYIYFKKLHQWLYVSL